MYIETIKISKTIWQTSTSMAYRLPLQLIVNFEKIPLTDWNFLL